MSVLFRSTKTRGLTTPLSIAWDDGGVTAVVVLIDNWLASDPVWAQYVQRLEDEAETRGLDARMIPITMDTGVSDNGLNVHALRWCHWMGSEDERNQRLLRELTSEFIRMLRHHLGEMQNPDAPDALENYLKNVRVFLSHSKHDEHGKPVAKAVREWLYDNSSLSSFFDVRDIPAGLPFADVLDHSIRIGVLLAIYTDSYSSRPWCRHEVIEAKRHGAPMLVVDCLQTVDERALPYLGNVPVIRMDPDRRDRIDEIAGLLLDEVFKDFLWQCRVERFRHSHPQITFMTRPPEMISLLALPHNNGERERTIVYPDPPLSVEEARLLCDVVCDLRLHSLTQWQGEAEG